MVRAALCYTPSLSNPINLQTHRNTQKPFSCNRIRRPVVCAAVRTAPSTRIGTLYDKLELSPDVGISDIKQAYRQMARRYHPDVCPSHQAEESTRRFIEIQEAYEILSDPRLRAVYDHAVAMGRSSAATGRMPWMSNDVTSQWKSQWEDQLTELRHWSTMKAGKDSWSARVRREQGLDDA
eukprot:c21829_g1_i1 orf=220-759(-)